MVLSEEIVVKQHEIPAPAPNDSGKRIEWTGTGGQHFLAVVVGPGDEVVDECWGNRSEIEAWIRERWPSLPAQYVPMAGDRSPE